MEFCGGFISCFMELQYGRILSCNIFRYPQRSIVRQPWLAHLLSLRLLVIFDCLVVLFLVRSQCIVVCFSQVNLVLDMLVRVCNILLVHILHMFEGVEFPRSGIYTFSGDRHFIYSFTPRRTWSSTSSISRNVRRYLASCTAIVA